MDDRPLRILQVNMFDIFGGAEKVAWDLMETYRARGHEAWIAVGRKRGDHPAVWTLTNDTAAAVWPRFWWRIHRRLQPFYGRSPRVRMLCRMVHRLAEPEGLIENWRGIEDFNYPGTWQLLDAAPHRPDIIHCHNLHQKYFDLRALPALSRRVPVVLTLHDAWLLSGHCAHSFDCRRWLTGCGQCPDLTIHPPIRRDATAYNWKRKRDIYAAGRFNLATPCRWLMARVEQSILKPGLVETRVIPYGINLEVFQPADQQAARSAANLPQDAIILLFAASGIRGNIWKDYKTLREAVARVAEQLPQRQILFLALGETAPAEHIGRAEIRFIPFERTPDAVARYYQAADLYVHAARADTFPNVVLESLACGTPVVATAVGGIPEQIRGARLPSIQDSAQTTSQPPERATGALVPPGDAPAMAATIKRLIEDQALRRQLGENAVTDARERFDLQRQADDYLGWYQHLRERFAATGE